MAQTTHIEWATATWNPLLGCRRKSPGCENCYAEGDARRMVLRLRGSIAKQGKTPGREAALERYSKVIAFDGEEPLAKWNGKTATDGRRLADPQKWRTHERIFVDSMTDLYYEGFPFEEIARVWAHMFAAPWHDYLIATKRAERALEFDEWAKGRDPLAAGLGDEPEHVQEAWAENHAAPSFANVWIGASVESPDYLARLGSVIRTRSEVPWVSAEPLLARLSGFGRYVLHAGARLEWVVCGGESGTRARPMHPAAARHLRDLTVDAGIPFFFKQWGAWVPQVELAPKRARLAVVNPDGVSRYPTVAAAHAAAESEAVWMRKVAKHAAGHALDDAVWQQFPSAYEARRAA